MACCVDPANDAGHRPVTPSHSPMRPTTLLDRFLGLLVWVALTLYCKLRGRPRTQTVYVRDPDGEMQPTEVKCPITTDELDNLYGEGNWGL